MPHTSHCMISILLSGMYDVRFRGMQFRATSNTILDYIRWGQQSVLDAGIGSCRLEIRLGDLWVKNALARSSAFGEGHRKIEKGVWTEDRRVRALVLVPHVVLQLPF